MLDVPNSFPDTPTPPDKRGNAQSVPFVPGKRIDSWTEAEHNALCEHWPDLQRISDLIGRTVHSVYCYGFRRGFRTAGDAQGLKRQTGSYWTVAQKEEALRLYRDGQSAAQIAATLGTTRNAIIGFLNRNKCLGTPSRNRQTLALARPWTKERIDELKRLWPQSLTVEQIAKRMGLRYRMVESKARRLKLGKRAYIRTKPAGRPPRGIDFSRPPRIPDPAPHERVAIHDLKRHHCRSVLDDGNYCGRKTCSRGSGAYCQHHAEVFYLRTYRKPSGTGFDFKRLANG